MARSREIEEFLSSRVSAGVFPGASYLIAERDRVLAEGAVGHAVLQPEKIEASKATIYDLASLTKPLATALIIGQLNSARRIGLDDPVSNHLPGWRSDAEDERSSITILDLLTHRSGLPGWRPLYLHAADRKGRIEWLRESPLNFSPGRSVEYSDPGYILLGMLLETVTGEGLDTVFADRVSGPLDLEDLGFRPPAQKRSRIAATEMGNGRERELAGPEGDLYTGWREEAIRGEVHDHNAHTMGGVAGHSGLFGTARDVYALAREFLSERSGVVPGDVREIFRTNFTPGLSQDRAVGFQLASTKGCSAGEAISSRSFGHVGFTGTSVWIDPDALKIHVLLTNRVHPRFLPIDMNAVRREFHRLATAL